MSSMIHLKELVASIAMPDSLSNVGLIVFGVIAVIALLQFLFLIWFVRKAIVHGFGAELRIPSILYFRITAAKKQKPEMKRTTAAQAQQPEPCDRDVSALFGQRLRQWRMDLGITIKQLAQTLNLRPAALSKIENGKGDLTIELADKLAVALSLSGQELAEFRELSRQVIPSRQGTDGR